MEDHFIHMTFFLPFRSNWEGRLLQSRSRWLMRPLTIIFYGVGIGFTIWKRSCHHSSWFFVFLWIGRLRRLIKDPLIILVGKHCRDILSQLSIILNRQVRILGWACHPSLMGTFSCIALIFMISSSLVKDSMLLSSVPFHTSHMEDPWTFHSPSTSREVSIPTEMDIPFPTT